MNTAQPTNDVCTLDDAAESLVARLASVGVTVALRLRMQPRILATPHLVLAGDAIDARLALPDGRWLAGAPESATVRDVVTRWLGDSINTLHACWALATTVDDTLCNLRGALLALPFTPDDEAQREQLIESSTVVDLGSLLAAARGSDNAVSPGLWGLAIALLIDVWRKGGEAPPVIEALPILLQRHPVVAAGDAPALVKLCVNALDLLHWEVSGAADDDRDVVVAALLALVHFLRRIGRDELAARLAIDGSDLAKPGSAAAVEAASVAITAAGAASHDVLTAFGRVLLAESLAAAVDPAMRPQAFDAAEQAVDALAKLDTVQRHALAQQLVAGLAANQAYAPLRALASTLAIGALPDPAVWQSRVQHEPLESWLSSVRGLYAASSIWFAVDDARSALQPSATVAHARADWTHWTVDHPAYRRAIPHHRSFLRERDFDRNLLVLTHELTHVLSLLGGVGTALACLRTAGLAIELAMWHSHAAPGAGRACGAGPLQRLATDGLAPLPPGRSAALADVGYALALHRKAQGLQAVWTPWFEGLAVFGETAADPLHDEEVVDPVNDSLRNLVDLPPAAASGGATAVKGALLAVIEEFQQRSAMALQRHGAGRLQDYLYEQDAPYWVGYLAVRAVVAAWRRTLGRPLSGAQAFRLLLHATRYDHDGMIPSLALDELAFLEAAERAMLQWVQRLAALAADDIELLLRAQEGGEPSAVVRWTRGRPAVANDNAIAAIAERLREGVQQALTGVANPFLRAGFTLDALARHANQTIVLGSFLPIGRADAPFHLAVDPQDGVGHLMLLLRTTEHHVDGGSSMNLHGVALPPATAQELANEVARSGATRIEVTRVVDLGGIVAPDLGLTGMHLLALRCGTWFEVQGATPIVDLVLGAAPGRAADLRDMLRARLLPDQAMRMEREIVATPEFAAVRAIEWVRATETWDASAPDGDPAVRAIDVNAAAERIMLHARRAPGLWPLQPLMEALLGDAALAGRIASADFRTLTRELPEHRSALVSALFQSAQQVLPDTVGAALWQALERNRLMILQRRPEGWDVVSR